MWYSINYIAFFKLLLPVEHRTARIMAYLEALITPLLNLHYTWRQNRTANIYKLEHNGQVCYLRGALNDTFDADLRRIYIGEGELYDTLYIYTEGENQDLYVHTETEPDTQWIRTEAETADTGVDFIVFVPTSLIQAQELEIRGLIDFYRAAGRRYIIIEING